MAQARLRSMGDAALLLELAPEAVLPLAEALRRRGHPAVTDIVPAERTVLIRFEPARAARDQIVDWLRSTPVGAAGSTEAARVEIGVHYDGDDLAEVGRLTGLTPAEVIAAHTGQDWLVAFSGFAPGFGYLRGSAGDLGVPRRDEPRVRVPAGSVALAAGYTGIYPRASPGGWQLIGRTQAQLWDADRDPPALLRPGVRVRFRELSS